MAHIWKGKIREFNSLKIRACTPVCKTSIRAFAAATSFCRKDITIAAPSPFLLAPAPRPSNSCMHTYEEQSFRMRFRAAGIVVNRVEGLREKELQLIFPACGVSIG